MSETAANDSLTTLWNLGTPLRVMARGIAVLRKPYGPSTLCRVIREVLDGAAVTEPASK